MGITQRLMSLQDIEYKSFQCKLMPTIDPDTVIGIRVPLLRKLAKELSGSEEARDFMNSLPHRYYDENNLHGSLICQIKDYAACVSAINAFLPYIDNWATCDLTSPKVFKNHVQELLPHITGWLDSQHTYTIRFAIKMLMDFYLDEHFSLRYPEIVCSVRSDEYYVNMMIAWYFATALAKQYDAILPYLEQNRLDDRTHNKAIRKAIESNRITAEQKSYLRTLRRK